MRWLTSLDLETRAMRQETVETIRRGAIGEALNLGCDVALIRALGYCESMDDLRRTANQAAGPGSESLSKWLRVAINHLEQER